MVFHFNVKFSQVVFASWPWLSKEIGQLLITWYFHFNFYINRCWDEYFWHFFLWKKKWPTSQRELADLERFLIWQSFYPHTRIYWCVISFSHQFLDRNVNVCSATFLQIFTKIYAVFLRLTHQSIYNYKISHGNMQYFLICHWCLKGAFSARLLQQSRRNEILM